MPGFLLHLGATVTCSHGGQAMPTVPNPQVTVSGQPTATLAGPWAVAGCPLVPPAPGPCVTGMWTVGTTRVTSNGQPLVIMGGVATCVPSGTPLLPVVSQTRVTAT
jgi:uncharacterized Zn-binding protein involved in type VI secretion